jgi:transcriptional regulator with XRE-family HTH domain
MAIQHLSGSTLTVGDLTPSGREKNAAKNVNSSPGTCDLEDLRLQPKAFLRLTEIPGQLRLARERAGYSINYLAGEFNIHPNTIRDLEEGETNIPVSKLKKIAEYLRVDLSRFRVPRVFVNPNDTASGRDLDKFLPYQLGPAAPKNWELSLFEGITWRPLFDTFQDFEHWIHGHVFNLQQGARIPLEYAATSAGSVHDQYVNTYLGPFGLQSWIALDGGFNYIPSDSSDRGDSFSAGGRRVLHLRNRAAGVLEAASPCRILHLDHSAICSCRRPNFIDRGSTA